MNALADRVGRRLVVGRDGDLAQVRERAFRWSLVPIAWDGFSSIPVSDVERRAVAGAEGLAVEFASVGAALAELRAARAAELFTEPLRLLPDCVSLRAAFAADGYPVKTMACPHERGPRVFGPFLASDRELAVWCFSRLATYDRRFKDGRGPAVVRWLNSNAAWLEAWGELFASVRRVASALDALSSELFVVSRAVREEEEAAEAARVRAAADLAAKRKEDMRRALSEAARASSKILGYAVLSPRDLDDLRPRWLYVLLGHNGTLYAGSGLSVRARLRAHRRGTGAAVTRDTRQPWYLLHAERFAVGSAALCAEFALLHSPPMQEALLFQVAARARRMHARFGCAVPWLGLAAR